MLYLGTRLYHLDLAPARSLTEDEYAWTWSGMTLIQRGTPEAWSMLTAYLPVRRNIEWRGHRYRMVKPWLDHPPLYALYAGGWMLALGQRDMFEVDLWQMRLGSLLLDAVCFVLLSLVLRRLLPTAEILVALLLYAVMPAIVLHQRLVICENMYVPLTLGILLLLLQQSREFARARALAIFALCAALPLLKVAALTSSVFLLLWALIDGAPRERWISAGTIALGTGTGLGVYLWYAQHVDANLFWEVMTNQQDRWKGFAGMEALLFTPRLVNQGLRDLLAVLGCVLALASLTLPRMAAWGLAVLAYTACMAFFMDQERVYGWYFLPLYPWFCTALGVAIVHASRQRVLGLSLLWCTVAWLTIASVLHGRTQLPVDVLRYGYLAGLLLLYGAWAAWPVLARASIPIVNGVLLGGAALACLYEVHAR